MTTKLTESAHEPFTIVWYFEDTDVEGEFVGACAHSLAYYEKKIETARDSHADDESYREDLIEYYFVERAALELAHQHPAKITHGRFGWVYRDKATLRLALRTLRTAHKAGTAYARSMKPLPAWAVHAKAAGWTPPKGWMP